MDIDTLEAGWDLDALVAEKVMGCKVVRYENRYPTCASAYRNMPTCGCRGEIHNSPEPNDDFLAEFSTDIAAAWQVLEAIPRCFWPEVGRMDDGSWYCEIVGRGDTPAQVSDGPIAKCVAPTAPLAICRAALKAMA